ncbi:MAG: tRNA (cytosine(32)/uridine(32)-2'-O)-methyltransferase TrmJ [Gammaproteobacteria bacterium]|nr:MAG: tRNA (cytosine(32)/uridine(32)-2'-O)-methyltransferase TrmJ [Gammaproteobacteria bacterium]
MPDHIRIVLVRPSHPGNIGATARAMMTMGLGRLVLVQPARFQSQEAIARASGAVGILEQAVCCDSLHEAIGDCHLVLGTTARDRTLEWPQCTPREAAGRIAGLSSEQQAAIVFGTERIGLSNTELDLCHMMVRIPCNPEFSSLNLASAVQILCYEIMLMMGSKQNQERPTETLAKQEDMQRFYSHLHQVLVELEFLDEDNPRLLDRRLHRLFNRAGLVESEVQILRGILTAIQRKNG